MRFGRKRFGRRETGDGQTAVTENQERFAAATENVVR